MAMDGTFTIFYILGDVSNDDGVPWTQLPGFIGATHVFTAASAVCGNCNSQAQNKQLVTGTTPFTSRLIENVESGRLNSMRPADVNPFLVKNLKWRAQTVRIFHVRQQGEVAFPHLSTRLTRCRLMADKSTRVISREITISRSVSVARQRHFQAMRVRSAMRHTPTSLMRSLPILPKRMKWKAIEVEIAQGIELKTLARLISNGRKVFQQPLLYDLCELDSTFISSN